MLMPIDFDGLLGNLIDLKALCINTFGHFWDFLRYKKYISLSLNNNNNKNYSVLYKSIKKG